MSRSFSGVVGVGSASIQNCLIARASAAGFLGPSWAQWSAAAVPARAKVRAPSAMISFRASSSGAGASNPQ